MLFLGESKESIPTLEQALTTINGETPVIIEIKNNGKIGEIEQKVIDILRKYKGEVAVASFNPYVLGYFHQHAPEILRGHIAGSFKNEKMSLKEKFVMKRMMHIKKVSYADFIMYEAQTLPNRFVKKYKRLPLLAWTVTSQEQYMKVVKYCDNVIFQGFDPKI